MRPICLKFEAFASFVKETEIDFRPFANKLFLIAGETGAGKTTIFDALCYALFGEASGGQRLQRNLRSDFAEPGQKTWVELSFEHGGKNYRIIRNPAYSRPKLRGEGFTEVPSAVELHLPDGKILSKKSEVEEQINNILGQRLEEFRQTSMLAQGEFSRFLQANSDEKAKIFREIFNTRKIVEFQEKLKAEVKRQADELKQLRHKEYELIQQISLSSEDLELAKKPFLEVESAGYKDLSPFWEIFIISQNSDEEKLALLRSELEEQDKQEKAFEKKRAEAENWLQQKDRWQELYATLLEARKDLENKEEREKELKVHKQMLRLVDPPAKTYQHWQKAVEESESELKIHIAAYETSLEHMADNLAAEQEELQAGAEQAEQVKHALLNLQDSLAQYKLLDSIQGEFKDVENSFITLQKELKILENKEKSSEEKLVVLKSEAQNLGQAIKNTSIAQEEARKCSEKREQAEELKEQYSEYLADLTALEACRRLYKTCDETFQNHYQKYQDLEQKFLATEIYRLAQKLKPSQPCPVCGSVHHPAPAKETSAEVVSQEELEEARKEQENAGEALREMKNKQQEAAAKVAEKRKSLENLSRKIHFALAIPNMSGEQTDNEHSPEELLQVLRAEYKEAQLKLDQAKSKQEIAEKAVDEVEREEKSLFELRKIIKEKQQECSERGNEVNVVKQKLAVVQAKLRYKDKQSAEQAYADLSQAVKERAERLSALDKAREDFQEKQKNYRDKTMNLQARWESHKEALVLAKEELDKALLKCGLRNLSVYLDLKLSEDLLSEKEALLSKDIDNLRQAEADESAFRKTWDKEAQHQPLEELDLLIQDLGDKINEKRREEKAVEYRYKRNCELAEDLNILAKDLAEAEAYYDQSKELSDVANGNLSGGVKTDFENYIQAYYFKQIIESANFRLIEMSGGRYLLKYKEAPDDMRKVSGLDLDIRDNFSGKDRPVSTLSGGESFLASLALALGLSDIAGWQNRNISVETLFIDEGFGSLDRDSLNKAIDILQSISKDNYLCGIISHVDILKEKIPYRIDVKKGRNGSNLEIIGV